MVVVLQDKEEPEEVHSLLVEANLDLLRVKPRHRKDPQTHEKKSDDDDVLMLLAKVRGWPLLIFMQYSTGLPVK